VYGIIGKITAAPGKRDQLIEILLAGTQARPGCQLYVVSRDAEEADSLWITEVWDDEQSHQRSLELPAVQAAITQGRPLIASFAARHTIEPVGGQGL